MAKIAWVQKILQELKIHLLEPLVMFYDNISVGYLSKHLVYHAKVKHIYIDFCFVREKVLTGALVATYTPT